MQREQSGRPPERVLLWVVFLFLFMLLSAPCPYRVVVYVGVAQARIATCFGVLVVPDLQSTSTKGHHAIAVTTYLAPSRRRPHRHRSVPFSPPSPPPPPAGPSSHACPPYSFSGGGGGCCRRRSRAQPPGGAEPVPLAAAHPRGGAARHAAHPRRPCTPLPALLCVPWVLLVAHIFFRIPARELLTWWARVGERCLQRD